MDLHDFQHRFTAALKEPTSDLTFFENVASNRAALAIYRNNVAYSLREVLAVGFPVVARLLGEDLFNAIATDFLRTHLPTSRSLTDYGTGFIDFLRTHRAVASYPWLCDVARIEMTRRQMFYAANDIPLLPQHLEGLSDDAIAAKTYSLRADVRLLLLDWPADEIWHAHQMGDPPEMEMVSAPTHLLVRRQGENVLVERLDETLAIFLRHFEKGARLDHATAATLARNADFDLAQVLSIVFSKTLFQKEG